MKESALVSIIIPCYNAEKYIAETINSALKQSYKDLEIICLNDGSTDRSEDIIKSIQDPRMQYISKKNSGVSDTRNKGLKLAKGKYVLFLDADDLLSVEFLEKRVLFMEQYLSIGFCSSKVFKIDSAGKVFSDEMWTGVSTDLVEEILCYRSQIITCPSTYLIRRDIMINNAVYFNTKLSSSADRFFLIELSRYTVGGLIKNGAELYYRIHPESMSNKLSLNLINDNILYCKELERKKYIPKELSKDFHFKINYIFAGSFFHLKMMAPAIKFSLIAFYYNPINFIKRLKK